MNQSRGRHVSRQLNKFLSERELAVLDLAGQPYEPGLSVEVLDVIHDVEMADDTQVIDETVTPIVMWRGAVVQFGQVIVRRKESINK